MASRQKGKARGASAKSGGSAKGFYLVLVGVAVVGVVALFAVRRGDGETSGVAPLSVAELAAEADPEAGVALGPEDAPVTIMEFSDFQCPHCRDFNALTGILLRQNFTGEGGPVRWVSYDFPLGGFPNSIPAAIAGRCAEEQGAFWPMHDLLYARQQSWAREGNPARRFSGYARDLGLDGEAFDACQKERRHLDEIMGSRRYGDQLGVRGTPTLFINGQRLDRIPSYEEFERAIRQVAARSAAVGGTGTE